MWVRLWRNSQETEISLRYWKTFSTNVIKSPQEKESNNLKIFSKHLNRIQEETGSITWIMHPIKTIIKFFSFTNEQSTTHSLDDAGCCHSINYDVYISNGRGYKIFQINLECRKVEQKLAPVVSEGNSDWAHDQLH